MAEEFFLFIGKVIFCLKKVIINFKYLFTNNTNFIFWEF